MVDDSDFTPRLGKLRDTGADSSKRFRSRVLKATKGFATQQGKSKFSGARYGRGGASAMYAHQCAPRLSKMRMRRVVVKVHIARANGGIGIRAYGRHLDYIQRDGVDRGGGGGDLYSRDGEIGSGRSFVERSRDDRHQFRIIVSPEDAHALPDMKVSTRALMNQMERDLGTPLDWVAVDHHNTGHSHTHIVVRGRDAQGADLIIARDYLTKGLRARAEETITQELGPRRDVEIAEARYRQVSQDRFTSLDRELAKLSVEGRVELSAMAGSGGCFMRSLYQQ